MIDLFTNKDEQYSNLVLIRMSNFNVLNNKIFSDLKNF